jgi:hypothetical protein
VFSGYFDLVAYIVVYSTLPVLTVNVQACHLEDPPQLKQFSQDFSIFQHLMKTGFMAQLAARTIPNRKAGSSNLSELYMDSTYIHMSCYACTSVCMYYYGHKPTC